MANRKWEVLEGFSFDIFSSHLVGLWRSCALLLGPSHQRLMQFFFSPLVFPPSSTLPNETASAISATTGEFFSRYHDLLIDRYSLVSEIVLPFFFLDGNILVRRVGEVPVGGRRGGRPIFESGFKKKKRKKATSQLNTHKHTGAKTWQRERGLTNKFVWKTEM